jgi:hypothetical protein
MVSSRGELAPDRMKEMLKGLVPGERLELPTP